MMANKFEEIIRQTIADLIKERDDLSAKLAETKQQNDDVVQDNLKLTVQLDERNKLVDYLKHQINSHNDNATIAKNFIDVARRLAGGGVDSDSVPSSHNATPRPNLSTEAILESQWETQPTTTGVKGVYDI